MRTPAFAAAVLGYLRRPAISLFLLIGLLAPCVPVSAAGADDKFWSVYDSKPQHPWNRVFRVLYEEDESWPRSVLHGRRYKDAVAALDHFLNTRAERLFNDPVKRVLFQNDLWKFFNWTLAHTGTWDDQPAVLALRQRLVRIMRRVALTRAETENLPDTYASVIRTGTYPGAYDPANREQAFLPPDLWEENGPWVLLGNRSEHKPAAILHAQQMGGASDFFVLLSLPDGRAETVRMLGQLGAFSYVHAMGNLAYLKRENRGLDFVPELPKLDDKKFETWITSLPPIGTRVALVRQMRVIDTTGYSYPTPIIESVQIRVYRDAQLPLQFSPPPGDSGFHPAMPQQLQDVYVVRLDRKALAAGAANSLRSVAIGEYTRNPNFINGTPPPAEIRPASAAPPLNAGAIRIVHSCGMCHGSADLTSLMTVVRAFMAGDGAPKLHASERKHEEGKGNVTQQYRLGYLRAIWDSVRD